MKTIPSLDRFQAQSKWEISNQKRVIGMRVWHPTRRQVLAAAVAAGSGLASTSAPKGVGKGTNNVKKEVGSVRANDGVQLYFEQAGSGTPLILIHGGGLSLVWWRRNFPVLANDFHVIAADTRGCGRSDKPAWGHRTARYAKDVYDIIEALNLDDVTLVGWSIGARTCYSYLELFGRHRLRAIVIVDETVHNEVHQAPTPGSEKQPRESNEAYRQRSLRSMVSPRDPDKVTDEELKWMMASESNLPVTLGADYRAQDWRPLCPVIGVPVLITAGRHSTALPGRCLYAAEHIPGANLIVFEQSGHCPFYTEADKFNRVVTEFVNGTPRS
jgi:pimeloyl-ACP methyl ester carboxylesterase